jgi:hypothetical protein
LHPTQKKLLKCPTETLLPVNLAMDLFIVAFKEKNCGGRNQIESGSEGAFSSHRFAVTQSHCLAASSRLP